MNMAKKRTIRQKLIAGLLLAALCTGLAGQAQAEAAIAKPKITLKERGKKKADIKVTQSGTYTGHQVWRAMSKNGKYRQIDGFPIHAKAYTYTFKKLKANKVYYVKLRAYRTKGPRITCGKWSNVLKIGKYKKPKPTLKPTPKPTPSETPTPTSTATPGGIVVPTDTATPPGIVVPTDTVTPSGMLAPVDTVAPSNVPTPTDTIMPSSVPISADTAAPSSVPVLTDILVQRKASFK